VNLELVTQKPKSDAHATPILFVHGGFYAAWSWELFLPYFAKNGYTSYALSLRGHGNSDGAEKLRWTSLNDYVSDVAQVVMQLGQPPVLIGHSMGGMIVQKYLESYQVPAAVLLASAPPSGLIPLALRSFTRYPLEFVKANLTLNLYNLMADPDHFRSLLFSQDMPEKQLIEYHSQISNESYRAFVDMMFLNLPRRKKINPTPMLVLGAKDDFMVTTREVETTARVYDTQAIFSGVGHTMILEKEWQSVADRILEWLDGQGL